MKKIILVVALTFAFIFPQSADAAAFKDLSPKHWAHDSITSMAEQGILNGYSNGTFRPNEFITRAQAALILARALELPARTEFKPKFGDVGPRHYAYDEIAVLTEREVFADANHFNPDALLSRAQMAKVIIEGFEITVDDNHLKSYLDVPASQWAHDYIITMSEVGITHGVDQTRFDPYGKVTRAQLAAFTDRTLLFQEQVRTGTVTYDGDRKIYAGKKEKAYGTIAAVNAERKSKGLSILKEDPALSAIAQKKAEDMVKNNYFAHESPTYGKPYEMAVKLGYPTNQVGENIARGFFTVEDVMQGWFDSKLHYENMLHAPYTVIGIGYAEDSDGFPYWVHQFAILP